MKLLLLAVFSVYYFGLALLKLIVDIRGHVLALPREKNNRKFYPDPHCCIDCQSPWLCPWPRGLYCLGCGARYKIAKEVKEPNVINSKSFDITDGPMDVKFSVAYLQQEDLQFLNHVKLNDGIELYYMRHRFFDITPHYPSVSWYRISRAVEFERQSGFNDKLIYSKFVNVDPMPDPCYLNVTENKQETVTECL